MVLERKQTAVDAVDALDDRADLLITERVAAKVLVILSETC